MGGIIFIVYDNKINIGVDFVKSFLKIKHRGPDDTIYTSESSVNIYNQNMNQISSVLSRGEIAKYIQYTFITGYHRMAITDISYDGSQPFVDPIRNMIMQDNYDKNKNPDNYRDLKSRPIRKLVCNGEIYNYNNLKEIHKFNNKDIQSNCDVEIILPLYIQYINENNTPDESIIKTLNDLYGEFALVLTENIDTFITDSINIFVARDFLGIKPLFYISNTENTFWMFVSEIKAIPYFVINNKDYNIIQVPAGSYWSFQNVINNKNSKDLSKCFTKYYDITKYRNIDSCTICNTDPDTLDSIYSNINSILTNSVIKRYANTIRPIGILLSGGFDSSIIVSIIMKYLKNSDACVIHLFTIGDSLGSSDIDIEYTKDFIILLETKYPNINIEHHMININEIEILTIDIDKIIYILETFDYKTIQQSIPFYYLFKYISEKTDIKILLSGDGLNDLCGHYTNLDDNEFQSKSVDVLCNLSKYNLLRTDRISQSFGLEIRHPFLDKIFVEYILSIHPKIKTKQIYKNTKEPIEKYIIRKSFDIDNEIIINENILWRSKSCLCNSLTNFELRLTNYFNNSISDQEYNLYLNNLMQIPGINNLTLPSTKEQLFYRKIFDKYYPNRSYLVPTFWNSFLHQS